MATAIRRAAAAPAAPPARRAGPPARRTATAAAVSSGYRGAAGLAKMQEEEALSEQRKEARESMAGMPFRFFCPQGDTREIVVVDDKPDWFRYEHNLKNPSSGKWDIFTACLNEHCNCPSCKVSDKGAYFALYLTVIDLTPYINRDDEEIPWSKKLLVVKSTQQKKIMRLFEREGTLRGMVLAMTRDGEKDASIGNDIEFVEFMPEDDLALYETVYTDKKGKEHEVIGHEAFDYDGLFPMPTEEELIALVGGRHESGSRQGDRRELRGGGGREGGSGDGWDQGGGSRSVRRRAPDDAPPARSAVRRAVRPAEDEPAEEVEAREPARRAPPPRTAPASSRAAPARQAPARRGPPAAEEDAPQRPAARAPVRRAAPAAEPEEQQEAPAESLAARRRGLRGR